MTGDDEQRDLTRALSFAREHVLAAVDGLDADALRRPVAPSGWTCLSLLHHLTLDVERFWFAAIVAAEPAAISEIVDGQVDAWQVGPEVAASAIVEGYRSAVGRAEAILAVTDLDAAPGWWPEHLFGSWRYDTVRQILLHVLSETATHAGHLDIVRELIDGHQHLVLTG